MEDILNIAKNVCKEYGFYPISLSYPDMKINEHKTEKTKDYGYIIPGDKKTYIFENEDVYKNDYAVSKFGLTCKKGGWVCFRHLEIVSAYTLPLMNDIDECPKYSMVHYPKDIFSEIVKRKNELLENENLYNKFLDKLITHFKDNLTCSKMIDYVLNITNAKDVNNVLFIDSKVPIKPDYLSMLILIGLKLKFGMKCDVAYPVDYIYEETKVNTKKLYGKGFGYTKILSADIKSENEINSNQDEIINNIKLKKYDIIVYGSIKRSSYLFNMVSDIYPKEKIVCMYGEDINKYAKNFCNVYKDKCQLFVREIFWKKNYMEKVLDTLKFYLQIITIPKNWTGQ